MNATPKVCLILLVLGCASCGNRSPEQQTRSHPLLQKLQQCGLNTSKATVVDAPPNERHILVSGHSKISRQNQDCLANLLVRENYGLRTSDADFEAAYSVSWEHAYRRQQAEKARRWLADERPEIVLRAYPKGSSLQVFVESIERACGAKAGIARAGVEFSHKYIFFPEARPSDPNTDCVEAALSVGLADEDVKISRWQGVP